MLSWENKINKDPRIICCNYVLDTNWLCCIHLNVVVDLEHLKGGANFIESEWEPMKQRSKKINLIKNSLNLCGAAIKLQLSNFMKVSEKNFSLAFKVTTWHHQLEDLFFKKQTHDESSNLCFLTTCNNVVVYWRLYLARCKSWKL